MKERFAKKDSFANLLNEFAVVFGVIAAGSKCMCIYHNLLRPEGIEKFKRN